MIVHLLKPIELTDDQKKELIDICNRTYPNLKFRFWEDNEGLTDDFGYSSTYLKDEHYPALCIHWFEFLVRTILNNDLEELENFYHKISQ